MRPDCLADVQQLLELRLRQLQHGDGPHFQDRHEDGGGGRATGLRQQQRRQQREHQRQHGVHVERKFRRRVEYQPVVDGLPDEGDDFVLAEPRQRRVDAGPFIRDGTARPGRTALSVRRHEAREADEDSGRLRGRLPLRVRPGHRQGRRVQAGSRPRLAQSTGRHNR